MLSEIELISERLERSALESLHEHCPAEARAALGLRLVRVKDVSVAVSSADPSILINRAIGLGTEEPATAETIAEVVETYRRHGYRRYGASNYFIHVYEDELSPEAARALDDCGLVRRRGWMKFRRDGAPAQAVATDLRIERIGPEWADDFGRIVCDAFEMSAAARPMMAGIVHDPRWHLYVSFDGDVPAGAGALFVEDGQGWLEWGATDPAFRRRGSQGAIMAARIDMAAELGCENLFTETGEAVEGDPQHSYGNIERSGFATLGLRANYGPPPRA
ncbi:MAG: GNAT family N-acetyltransferase [Alphaproteobacteria bacterium]|nr:GNAT family N-acetyltransferase [Alphaproteobacteria bacterium]